MSRRLLPLVLLLVPACHKQAEDPVVAAAAHAAPVPCALAGSARFVNDCTVERTVSPDGLTLVMHHPDGGFRRLQVATDGRGVVTADGADPAVVAVIEPATIEVTVGNDRYRLPATVKGQDLPGK